VALTSPVCGPRPSAQRPWRLRDRLDEHDIADLITAYREGTTAAHGLSLKTVKRLQHIPVSARRHPLDKL
jgi:hypothetical protein